MKILLIITTGLNLILSSGMAKNPINAPIVQVYQTNQPSEGSRHILVFTSVNGNYSGYYLGSETFTRHTKISIEEDTVYY